MFGGSKNPGIYIWITNKDKNKEIMMDGIHTVNIRTKKSLFIVIPYLTEPTG